MMRTTFVGLWMLACAFVATAAGWNGAGWYQVWETSDARGVNAGPFANQDACEAALPNDTDDRAYYCEYLDKSPF